MKKITKITLALIVIFIIAWVMFTHPNQSANRGSVEKQTVKIGLSLPLTGAVAFLGEPAKKSAELALMDAGNTKFKYELVFEDDQFAPAKAVTTVNKLINIDKVLGIISFGSGTGNAINAIAEKSQVTQFALASDPSAAEGNYNYIHWTPAFSEGQLLASELVKRKYKRVAIIDTNHPGPLAVTSAVKDALKNTDVEIVSYNVVNMGEKDFRTIINKIKQSKPDIIVLELFSPEIELAARQLKEQGVKIDTTSVETFEWSASPELFEGMWFVSDSIVPQFRQKYKSVYGEDPQSGSSYVYDLVSMMITLQEKQSKPIAPAELPSLISKMGTWDSPVFGKTEINSEGFFLTVPSVKIIKDGKVVEAQ